MQGVMDFGSAVITEEIKASTLIVEPCYVDAVAAFIEIHHYSGSIDGVKVSQCFRVSHKGETVGAVLFGQLSTTAWKKFADTELAVLELRRLVLLDRAGKNSESFVIGSCLRWIKKYLSHVKVIVSYADPEHGHDGTIYKASNFKLVGVTPKDKGFFDPESGKTYHSRALRTKYKGEYKPFVQKLRKQFDEGNLIPRTLEGKYCYIYNLANKKGC